MRLLSSCYCLFLCQALISSGLIPPLINLLGTAEHEVRREAAWAISNATSGGTREQIKYMVEHGAIPPICDLLDVPEPKMVNVALEALENILKVCVRVCPRASLSDGLVHSPISLRMLHPLPFLPHSPPALTPLSPPCAPYCFLSSLLLMSRLERRTPMPLEVTTCMR